jgi:integrase
MSEARAEEKGAAWRERMARERRGAAPSTPARGPTLQDVGRRWTSGELARDFPDHIKAKRTAERDVQRLDRYVYPIAGHLPIVDFTIDHAEAVMKALPPNRVRTPATRRHVAQLMHRILGIAVFPLRLIKVNPLPKGFMPKVGPSKAKGYLYPADDARLLACVDVPLDWRFWYGFLDREGPRTSEAESFTWGDFDLERGAVKLDENKTDDPRAWALSRGVVAALRAMRTRRKAAGVPVGPDDPVFILRTDGKKYDPAKLFREHSRIAGIDRPELFERSASRMHIRRHDLRATFVTLNLAAGRTETWIADRTGHKSSDMINKYRRAARTAEELNLGELAPLDAAIPELAHAPDTNGGSSPTSNGDPVDASGTEAWGGRRRRTRRVSDVLPFERG